MVFANPYHVDNGDPESREKVIKAYEKYIRGKISRGEVDKSTRQLYCPGIGALRGKTLGCWCRPLPCHGDVLIRLVNE
jgi:hypothetical protein